MREGERGQRGRKKGTTEKWKEKERKGGQSKKERKTES